MFILASLCVQIMFIESTYAGTTVISTSDSAPTYSGHGGHSNEVVTASNQTITLTTTCTNGTVSVTYTVSPTGGLTAMPSYPSGSGSSTETDVFYCGSAAIGQVNSISLNVTHTGSASSGTCQSGAGNTPTFYACIPVATAPLNGTPYNYFYEGDFQTIPTISGCDDFSQIQWTQQIKGKTTYTTYSGTAVNPTSPNYANTGTSYVADVNMDWQSPSSSPGTNQIAFTISGNNATSQYVDDHMTGTTYSNVPSILIDGNYYDYYILCNVFSSQFEEQLRRTADSKPLTASDYNWGYTWDNLNTQWTGATTPVTVSQFTTAMATTPASTTAAFGGRSRGTNTGEFTGVTGITLPTTHTP
jgi:hypothetical protein